MDEKFLLKISIICIIIGFVLLFSYMQLVGVEESGSASKGILRKNVEESPIIEGVVLGVRETEGATFIMLEKHETIPVTLFGDTPGIRRGDYVQVRGKFGTKNSQGSDELIGDEVRVIK